MARTYIWQKGTEAALPAPGVESRLYFATDTGRIFLDLTTSWQRTNLVPRGAYDGSATYYLHDLVVSGGSTWRAKQTVTGVTPVAGADWEPFSAKGDPGTNGNTVLSGSGAPGSGLGVNGDYYIDTAAYAIYGPKTAGAWGSPTSLIGPAGSGGNVNVKSNDSLVVSGALAIDFSAAFGVGQSPTGEANVTPTFGTTAGTIAQGNDSRFADTRTPTDATVTDAKVAAGAAIAESKLGLASDAVAGTASRRTLGTGAQQAAPGNDARFAKYTPLTIFYAGDVATKTGVGHDIVVVAGTIDEVYVGADSAPAGGSITVTFVKEAGGAGGTTTTVGSVTLAAASKNGSTTGLSVAVAKGDSVRMDVTTNAGYTAASAKNLTGKAREAY